jgi:tRNA(Ile)-lysidine synthase
MEISAADSATESSARALTETEIAALECRFLTDLQQALQQVGALRATIPVSVAFSGGLDSTVLLLLTQRLLQAQNQAHRLRAIHVHHGWEASDVFAQHAEQFCAQYTIPLTIMPVDARPQCGEGREAAARLARRAAFARSLQPDAVMLAAQHQDDQAETVMLRLLRGSGADALQAMEPCIQIGKGWLLRPWLQQTRGDLQVWATYRGVAWREDPSNADLTLDRNYLRSKVMPLLEERWPGVAQRFATVAQHAADTRGVLEQHFRQWLAVWDAQLDGERLPLAALRALDGPAQRLLLRAAGRARRVWLPGGKRLEEALQQFHQAGVSRQPELCWQDPEQGACGLRRYRDYLYWIQAQSAPTMPERSAWHPRSSRLRSLMPGQGIAPIWLRQSDWLLGRWMADARMRTALNRPRRSLRNLLQEAGIPPWQRDQLPCLWHGERLVAVDSLWIDPEYRAKPGEVGWIPDCATGFH